MFLQAWYFATPIIYELTELPPERPVAVLAEPGLSVHPAVPGRSSTSGQWPDLATFVLAAAIAAASLGVGYAAFKSL